MRCDLKIMMQSTPECDQQNCVYWNEACNEPAFQLSSCTLIRFGLIGKYPDKLARWLFHYMLLYSRNQTLALIAGSRNGNTRWAQSLE